MCSEYSVKDVPGIYPPLRGEGLRMRGQMTLPCDVIPDLIRNLAFINPVTWVRLEILKQVQDDRVGQMTLPCDVIPDLSGISVLLILLRGLG